MLICNFAVEALRSHKPVLVYDEDGREGEADIVLSAEGITPKDIQILRSQAGGLICVAIHPTVAQALRLPFMAEVLSAASRRYPTLKDITVSNAPYGDPPAFSLTVNHKDTYTGITDNDRALTIKSLAEIGQEALKAGSRESALRKFKENFRSPGHVHLLIGRNPLLESRRGHTELSLALAGIAGITPVMVLCEMLDGATGRARSRDSALQYAKEKGLPFLEGGEVVRLYSEFKGARRRYCET